MGVTELEAQPVRLAAAHVEDIVPYSGWWRSVWVRFNRHPLALTGAGMLAFVLILAFLGPMIAPAPRPDAEGTFTPVQINEILARDVPPQVHPLSWRYLFGTDDTAEPVLRQVLLGGKDPLLIGILGALLATIIGIVIGAVSGYVGGLTDTVWMRVVDMFLAMPFIPLVLLVTTSLLGGVPGSTYTLSRYIVLFGLLGWPGVARLIRGYVLSIREWDFVHSARAVGLSEPAVIFRHILPNVLGVIVVALTVNVAVFIGVEVTAEFLGAPPPAETTWGQTMRHGFDLLLGGIWWVALIPAAATLIAVLGVNLLGDGLRDAIDGFDHAPLTTRQAGTPSAAAGVALRLTAGVRGDLSRAFGALMSLDRLVTGSIARALDLTARPLRGRTLIRPSVQRLIGRRSIQIVPILAIISVAGIVFLAGHAPATYPQHFSSRFELAAIDDSAGYDLTPVGRGRIGLLFKRPTGGIVYQEFSSSGQPQAPPLLVSTSRAPTDFTLASTGPFRLALWLEHGDTATHLRAASIAGGHVKSFTLASAATVSHPSAFVAAHGGFDVLFQGSRSTEENIYLARLRAGSARPLSVGVLVHGHDAAVLPRGTVDGRGNIALVYLDLCCQSSEWKLQFRRFSRLGRPLGAAITLGVITTLTTFGRPAGEPAEWGMDVARAADGSVWAGGSADNGLYLGRWSGTGDNLIPPDALACAGSPCDGTATKELKIFSGPRASFVLSIYDDSQQGTRPFITRFSSQGQVIGQERVTYEYGGATSDVRLVPVRTTVLVAWEKHLYSGQTVIESAVYQPHGASSLAASLGLDVGPVWANLALAILGAVTAATAFTVINVFLLAVLLATWLVISHFVSGPLRWPLYTAALGSILAWIFAAHATPPVFVFVLSAWPAPFGAVAVVAATYVAAWSCLTFLRHQDDWFRAGAMALLSVYVLSLLQALVSIQALLARV